MGKRWNVAHGETKNFQVALRLRQLKYRIPPAQMMPHAVPQWNNGRPPKIIYTNASSILPKLMNHVILFVLQFLIYSLSQNIGCNLMFLILKSISKIYLFFIAKGWWGPIYVSTRLNSSIYFLKQFPAQNPSIIQFLIVSQTIEVLEQILKGVTLISFVHWTLFYSFGLNISSSWISKID